MYTNLSNLVKAVSVTLVLLLSACKTGANKNMDISTNQHNAADLAHTQLSTDKLDSFHKQITSTVLFPFDSSSLSKESKNIM